MNNLIIILFVLILLCVVYNKYSKKENLTYTNNCYNSLQKEIEILIELDSKYNRSVPKNEVLSNTYNKRDSDVYDIFSCV